MYISEFVCGILAGALMTFIGLAILGSGAGEGKDDGNDKN